MCGLFSYLIDRTDLKETRTSVKFRGKLTALNLEGKSYFLLMWT